MGQHILAALREKFKVARSFFHLGSGIKSKFFLVALVFLPFLKKRMPFLRAMTLDVQVRFGEKVFPLFLMGVYEEVVMLKEIFVGRSYQFDDKGKSIKTIFDLGANVGLSAIWFALQYPDATIYAFEPDPRTFTSLQKNVKHFKNIIPWQIAAGSTNGQVDFYVVPDRTISSSLKPREGGSKIAVESKKLDDVFLQLQIPTLDILKFDIEGAEYDVLQAFTHLPKTKFLLGEVHVDLLGVPVETFLQLLVQNGFVHNLQGIGKANRFAFVGENTHSHE